MKMYSLQVEKSAGMTGIPKINGYGSYFLICEIISVIVLRRASKADELPRPPGAAELMLRIIMGSPPCTWMLRARGVLGVAADADGSEEEDDGWRIESSICATVSLLAPTKFNDPRRNDLLLNGADPVKPSEATLGLVSDKSFSRADCGAMSMSPKLADAGRVMMAEPIESIHPRTIEFWDGCEVAAPSGGFTAETRCGAESSG